MNSLLLFKSSAGSGKTYTLVKEYLKLVLVKPAAYRQTLALTFTNKATAEMKSRIVSALVKLSEEEQNDLKLLIQQELNMPELPVKDQAKKVLELILHDYTGFAVTTLDSFFSGIVRSLAKEMNLPLKFEMEMNMDFVISRLSKMLMDDIGKSEALTHWLLQFVFDKIDDEKGWNIEHEIKSIAKELFSDKIQQNSEEDWGINLTFIALLKKIKSHVENEMQQFGKQFMRHIQQAGFEVNDFPYKDKGVAGYFFKLSNGLYGEKLKPGTRFMEALDSSAKWTTSGKGKNKQIIDLAESVLIPLANTTVNFYETHEKDYLSASEVLSVIYLAGIMNYLNKTLAAYRDENDILLISDNNRLINKFISDNDTPFLYEKTGNVFKNYLIDEFQDTADMQWKNLLPLVINGLSDGGLAMFVGDAKQSIYRWRGGNMKLLLENLTKDLSLFSALLVEKNLDSNYRSYKEIIDFNNHFFTIAPTLLPLAGIVQDKFAYHEKEILQKNIASKSFGGFISISLFPVKDIDENDEEIKWKEVALKKLVAVIQNCYANGYEPKDIAILIRTNKEGEIITNELFKNGFNKISSADSLQLATAPQVTFLINLLTLLVYPEEAPAMASAVYFYQHYILNSDLTDLNKLFNAAGKDSKPYHQQFFPPAWNEEKETFLTLPLYELSERLVDLFNLNKTPDAYIQRFQDLILEISGKNQTGIKDFLIWWDEHKDSEKLSVIVPMDKDALNLITIHRAKGLQYPVVIMPFLDWSLLPKSSQLLWISSAIEPYNQLTVFPVKVKKSLALSHFEADFSEETEANYIDNINLLYVAFTRAEEKLYLFTKEEENDEKEITKVSQLVNQVIKTSPEWKNKLIKNTNWQEFSLGSDHPKIGIPKDLKPGSIAFESPDSVKMDFYPYSRWQDKINVRIAKNLRSGEVENKTAEAIDFGLVMHETMSYIKQITDLPDALKRVAFLHKLSPKQIHTLQEEITLIFQLTEKEKWYSDTYTILNETEIAEPTGNIYRPDRILLKEKKAMVIDYKTGEKEPVHVNQVKQYVNMLEQLGYEPVEGYLLYLKTKEIQKV